LNSPVHLSGGYAPPEGFPGSELAEIAREILRNHAAEALQYSELEGQVALRTRIAEWLSADGTPATFRDVNIVTGAKQALDLAARALAQPGDAWMSSEPTYVNAIRIFRRAGLKHLSVSNDEDGTRVDEIEEALARMARAGTPMPKFIYEIPDFHNPTGRVMSASRREKLVAVATKYEIPILEDNPYRWLRYDGSAVPPLGSFDKDRWVIGVGTFSKILTPGLRLGWIHAREDLRRRVMSFKADGGSSALVQMMVREYFHEPDALPRRLDRVTTVLRSKRDAMLRALTTSLGTVAEWSRPDGGYYFWLSVGSGVDTEALAPVAETDGVQFYPGSMYYSAPERGRQQIRLSFAHEPIDRMERGVTILRSHLVGVLSPA
jgi:2-aminoadipate transaminase